MVKQPFHEATFLGSHFGVDPFGSSIRNLKGIETGKLYEIG